MTSAQLVGSDATDAGLLEAEILEAFCANPRCDERIQHSTGRGRKAKYHDDSCRRAAESDLRRLEARLRHFEAQAQMLRGQLGAYIEAEDGSSGPEEPTADELVRAKVAVGRAQGVLAHAGSAGEPYADELSMLLSAVEPILG